jgi:transposase
MVTAQTLENMNPQALRELAVNLLSTVDEYKQAIAITQNEIDRHKLEIATTRREIDQHKKELAYRQAKIDQLTHEIALNRRWKFGRHAEQLDSTQASLLDETLEADIAAMESELEALATPEKAQTVPKLPKRAALPANLPRVEFRHEPDSTLCHCGCQLKRIGEDVSEKLDYAPGLFTVERHIRGKWACGQCQTLRQAPVPPQVIDKGMATAGLLAQVLVAKYADHLPLYRQENIFARAGMALPRSTLAQWVGVCGVRLQPLVEALKNAILTCSVLHADETPVQMLKPGNKKTHRAYIWAYAPGAHHELKAVVYDFAEGRSGEHARTFVGDWRGSLVCDDFSGYKAMFANGITEVGCMAHARRKFFELHVANKSQIAQQAIELMSQLYDIERETKELDADQRKRIRQTKAKPVADTLFKWMQLQRQKVTDGSATAKALDYTLKRWSALTRYIDDGQLPIDNNWIENQIRPIAIGRSNWLFAGSLRAGQRAAAVMSLIQSAKMNGHDPYAYLKDVLTRLPTHKASQIEDLLPHLWQAPILNT